MTGDIAHFFGGPWDGRVVPINYPTLEFHVPQIAPYRVHIYRREPCPRDSFNSCAIRYNYAGVRPESLRPRMPPMWDKIG